MDKEYCDVKLQKDDKYGWTLKIKDDCNKLLTDIKENTGTYGWRYLVDRVVYNSSDKSDATSEKQSTDDV